MGPAPDAAGAAYVTGRTLCPDFPKLNPYQTYQGSGDVFVTKLSTGGSSLVYSTHLGRSRDEWVYGIAADAVGAAYVAGGTPSSDFPIFNQFQTYQGWSDVLVTKLIEDCCNHDGIRGDVNYDFSWRNIADLTYLVDHLFRGGPPPPACL